MIEVEHLSKRFGRTQAIEDLSFEVRRGEIVGFLGANGAGKTTLMRILSCFLPATAGRVGVAGFDVFSQSLEVRQRLGYLPESVPLYGEMRVLEYLKYRGRLKGLRGHELRRRIESVVEQCGITGNERKLIDTLSRGYRQRVGLADCLLHEPELLILDEPTIGLDPNQIRQIRRMIRGLAQKHTILLSSHILPEVESLCERILIMNRGRIVGGGSPTQLVDKLKGNVRVLLEVQADASAVQECLGAVEGVREVNCSAKDAWQRVVCECAGGDLRTELAHRVMQKGWPLRELRRERGKLEDVFVAMTADDEGGESEA